MPYARRLILHAPPWDAQSLVDFVEDCIRDGVVLVCVVGNDCQRVEDIIEELIVGDGSDSSRFFVNTTSHPEGLVEARELAEMWTLDVDVEELIQEVRLAEH